MRNVLFPRFQTVVASAAYTSTTTTAKFELPGVSDSYSIIMTHTVTGTSPTADIVLQTSVDGGTTYVNLPIRSTQVTATGTTHMVFRMGLGQNEVALESPAADTGGTLAKNCIFDPKFMKLKFTIGGTSPSFTTVVYAAAVPRGD
jgi:hypothetical protein